MIMWNELGLSGGTAIIILIALYFVIKWAVKNGIDVYKRQVYLQKYTRYRRQIPYRILYSFTYHDKVYYHKSRLVWEKPDLKKGDLITVYVNNLGKSTVYNCNKAV